MTEQETNVSLKSVMSQLKQISTLKRQVQKVLLEKSIQQISSDLQAANEIKGNYANEISDYVSILANDLKADIGTSLEGAKNLPSVLLETIRSKTALRKLDHKMESEELSPVELELIDQKKICQEKVRRAMERNNFKVASEYVSKAQEIDQQLLAQQIANGRSNANQKREQSAIVNANMESVRSCKENMKSNVKEIFSEYTEKKSKSKESKEQSLTNIENKGLMARIKNLFTKIRLGSMKARDSVSGQISTRLSSASSMFKNNISGLLEGIAQSNADRMDELLQTVSELESSQEKVSQVEPNKEPSVSFGEDLEQV